MTSIHQKVNFKLQIQSCYKRAKRKDKVMVPAHLRFDEWGCSQTGSHLQCPVKVHPVFRKYHWILFIHSAEVHSFGDGGLGFGAQGLQLATRALCECVSGIWRRRWRRNRSRRARSSCSWSEKATPCRHAYASFRMVVNLETRSAKRLPRPCQKPAVRASQSPTLPWYSLDYPRLFLNLLKFTREAVQCMKRMVVVS